MGLTDPAVRAAQMYTELGWALVRVKAVGKKAIDDGWPSMRPAPSAFNGLNIGVQLGEPSGWLVDVDIDCAEALHYADALLPQVPTLSFGRPGAPRTHRLYVAQGAIHAAYSFGKKADGHGTLVELRSTAHYTVFPGSIHESGEVIDWADLNEIATVDPTALRECVRRIGIHALLRRHGGVSAPVGFDNDYYEIEIEPKIPELVAKKAREWIGLDQKRKKKRTSTPLESTTEFKKAVAKFNAENPQDWPVSGGTCPACQHNDCFGMHPEDDNRWMCFSASHGDSGVGRETEGGGRFSGDVADLEAFELGMTVPQLLVKTGYLHGREALTLSRADNGQINPTLGNVVAVLKGDPAFDGCLRFDQFAAQEVWWKVPDMLRHVGVQPQDPVQDRDDISIATWIEQQYGFAVPPHVVTNAVREVAGHDQFHPIKQMIERAAWDGVKRIDTLLPTFFSTPDTPLNRAFGSRWLISAVARIYEPGIKADCALMLVGPQDEFKSTILEELAMNRKYFTDDLGGDVAEGKATAERLQGVWIVEAAEMATLRRAEINTVKAFISRKKDRYRPAYGRRTQDFPRQCVFAVTSNDTSSLVDHTGGRRFWPVAVPPHGIDILALRAVIPQLWAEALVRYHAGAPHWIDRRNEPELHAAAIETQEEHTVDSPHAEAIVHRANGHQAVVIDRILREINIDASRYPAVRQEAAAILTRIGFTNRGKVRVDGLPIRIWAKRSVTAEGQELASLLKPTSLTDPRFSKPN